MQSQEAACEEGERAFKKFKSSRNSLPLSCLPDSEAAETSSKKPFCLQSKLLELHKEEAEKNPSNFVTGLKRNSLLLEKLVARERPNTLVVNLYPGNKGYSLMVPMAPRNDSPSDDTANMIELEPFSYEEDRLLDYINNEELPSYIMDCLEWNYSFLFYNGCVIAEIRDYRQAYPESKCDIHHVLLRPSFQSILTDVENAPKDWTTDDRHQFESQLLMARAPNLCLTPDASVCGKLVRLHHARHVFNTHRLRRTARKFSQVAVNRKRRLYTHKGDAQLLDFVTRERARGASATSAAAATQQLFRIARKIHEELRPMPVPNLDLPLLSPPAGGVHITQFKAYQRPKETSDCLPQLMEEYVLETDVPLKEEGKKRLYHIKLSILQRPHNSEYLGELYLEWDHKEDAQNGVACRFSLGSKVHANKYIQQFTDIFTEYGRKRVKIKCGLNPMYKEKIVAAQTQAAQSQAARAAQLNLVQQHQSQLHQNQTPPMVNGAINSGINTNQQTQQPSVPMQQTNPTSPSKLAQQNRNKELKISALAAEFENIAHKFQAAENAKQQQKLASGGNNAAIINLLSSSPACNVNSETNAAVMNAINNTSLHPQLQTLNQKLLARKMTLANASNSRTSNQNNLMTTTTTVNNNRLTVSDFNVQPTSYTALKQRDGGGKSLSALLVGVASADRPELGSSASSASSVLLEKLAAASSSQGLGFGQGQNQYVAQSAKISPVISPMSSPPPQNAGTINVQGFGAFQNLVQLTGFQQPISLSLNGSSTGPGLIVSLPATTATATCTSATQQPGAATVVLANAGSSNLAQLVTSVKGLSQQNLRSPAGGQPFQLLAPMQRPRFQQANITQNIAQNIAVRGIQRTTPITIKMASPNSTQVAQLTSQQKQQVQQQQQQFQQLYALSRQKSVPSNAADKVRRRSSAAEPQ